MKSNQLVEQLNQNVADLHLVYIKLHNYHWNVKGPQFFQLHKLTEGFYEHIAELFDEVAERILQLGEQPLSTVRDYLQQAKIKEPNSAVSNPEHVISGIVDDFGYLLEQYKSILKVAEQQDDVGTANLVSEPIDWLEKSLWMLKASK
jgi:starvation-inducible DNA-binding protein